MAVGNRELNTKERDFGLFLSCFVSLAQKTEMQGYVFGVKKP